jgi:hypothetical protein
VSRRPARFHKPHAGRRPASGKSAFWPKKARRIGYSAEVNLNSSITHRLVANRLVNVVRVGFFWSVKDGRRPGRAGAGLPATSALA